MRLMRRCAGVRRGARVEAARTFSMSSGSRGALRKGRGKSCGLDFAVRDRTTAWKGVLQSMNAEATWRSTLIEDSPEATRTMLNHKDGLRFVPALSKH
jgi:hypothetical protein